jgi:hypothetical protein
VFSSQGRYVLFMKRMLVIAVSVTAVVVAVGVPGAAAHRDPCHRAHTCPSDHHTYLWHGLSCTS